jgi:CrcB protein
MDVRALLAVAAGAALGGVLRFIITSLVVARYGPGLSFIATLGINVSGSLAIGFVLEASALRMDSDPLLRLFLATGVLGGYTTFSTFSFEAIRMATQALTATALAYVFGSVGFGIVGAYLGIILARVVFR